MKATVRGVTGEFQEYEIENIVSVQYVSCNLILTCITDDGIKTLTYNAGNVIVEIH